MWVTYKCFICKEEGHRSMDIPKKKGPTVGRAYVMHAEETEEEPGTTFITATYALLDSEATYSFISETFVKRLKIIPEDFELGFRVSNPFGDQMVTTRIVKNLELRLQKDVVRADLIVLPMSEFEIILGMDWVSSNGASIGFRLRLVSIRPPSGKSFVFEAARNKQMQHIISCICARKLIKRSCQDFIACIT
ncbi:uncharacterized protein LOC142528386 [Primulina tabacum]|uniref:uncharacterized protein LOC142528386 n=1 Tax=Primulina tabacum TaxID=48773 RepID=UPI003F5A6AB0